MRLNSSRLDIDAITVYVVCCHTSGSVRSSVLPHIELNATLVLPYRHQRWTKLLDKLGSG